MIAATRSFGRAEAPAGDQQLGQGGAGQSAVRPVRQLVS